MKTLWIRDEFEIAAFIMSFFFSVFSVLKKKKKNLNSGGLVGRIMVSQ